MTTLADTDTLTIELIDDHRERFTGMPAAIVAEMNATAFAPCETPRAYVAQFNRFFALTNGGRTLRTESFAAFVEDMLTFGVARRVDSDKPSD